MVRLLLVVIGVSALTGCGIGRATSNLNSGFGRLECASTEFRGEAPCPPQP